MVAHLHEPAKSTANNVVPVSKAKLVASAPRDSSGAGGWSHQFRRVTFPTSGGGCPGSLDPRASWSRNPQFFLEVPEPCDVCISLSQRDTRFHGGTVALPRRLRHGGAAVFRPTDYTVRSTIRT